jgi:hypothetical protein
MASSVSTRQKATVERIKRTDPTATTEEVENVILASYTPKWERGRMVSGTYRENPNPQRVTHAITEDGKLHGWGFGPLQVKLPAAAEGKITSAEDMKAVLKTRDELRSPKPMVEDEPEVESTEEAKSEVEKPARKSTTRKATTRKRTGVQVSK